MYTIRVINILLGFYQGFLGGELEVHGHDAKFNSTGKWLD